MGHTPTPASPPGAWGWATLQFHQGNLVLSCTPTAHPYRAQLKTSRSHFRRTAPCSEG